MSANIIAKSCVLTALLVTVFTVVQLITLDFGCLLKVANSCYKLKEILRSFRYG